MRKTWLVLLWCVLPICVTRADVIIWSDGFESGDFSAWTSVNGNWAVVTSSAAAYSGSRGADIRGNTAPDDDILEVQISSVGYQNLELKYADKVREGLEVGDWVWVEITTDGLAWQELYSYTEQAATDWEVIRFDLPSAADNNPLFGFRMRGRLSTSFDRMNFDDFALTGTPIPDPATLGIILCLVFVFLPPHRE